MTLRQRLVDNLLRGVVVSFVMWLAYSCQATVNGQIHPFRATQGQTPAAVVLDAPLRGYSEWSLLVKVGENEFAIPRVELRKLAVAHADWRTK